MKKVIYDCDNTLGVKRSDIDDGITFAYLYAHPEIELLGITCTFGNNSEHVVYYNTVQMLKDLDINDVPVLKGGREPCEYNSEAVDFLVSMVNKYPGQITVIATGSLCNIAGAYKKDIDFFHKIESLIVMGGILGPLYLNGVLCRELNFSIDYESANQVLFNCDKLTVLSAQCTQNAIYGHEDVQRLLLQNTKFINKFAKEIIQWIEYINPQYGNRGIFINWDLCTAIYLTNPDLFVSKTRRIIPSKENLKIGFLQEDRDGTFHNVKYISIPEKINNISDFNHEFYSIISLF